MELVHPLFKWLHIIAGITWIGLLYLFNWINAHFAATLDADTKKKVVPELMPRTLFSFIEKEKLTTRDSRGVERKKYGHRKARRSFQFSKR